MQTVLVRMGMLFLALVACGHLRADTTPVFSGDPMRIEDELPAFERAGQLPEYVSSIEGMSGSDPHLLRILVRIGDALQLQNHPAEAERVYRKALTLSGRKQDAAASLIRLLITINRRTDAAKEFENWYMGGNASSWMPRFIAGPEQNSMIEAWYQANGRDGYPAINELTLPLLQEAEYLGLYAKLKQQLDARAGTKSVTALDPIDPSRLASLLLSIIARDPAYRLELDKLMSELVMLPAPTDYLSHASTPTAAGAAEVNLDALVVICEQLAKWPEERAAAVRLAQTNIPNFTLGDFDTTGFRMQAEYKVMLAAIAAGDGVMPRELLKDIVETGEKSSPMASERWPVDRAGMTEWLIHFEMFPEAEKQVTALFADFHGSDAAYGQKLDRIKTELAYAQGQVPPDGLVCGIEPATGQGNGGMTRFFWQLNAGQKGNDIYAGKADQPEGFYLGDVLWTETVPQRDSPYVLDIRAGPDEEHLSPLTMHPTVPKMGSELLKIPPDTRILKAFLLPAPAAPPIATGDSLVLGAPENLLHNPQFMATKNAQGVEEIAGWQGLIPANVTQGRGGPMYSKQYQVVDVPYYRTDMSAFEIASDPIPLKPDTDYLLSAWQHDGMDPRFLFLDASGMELRSLHSIKGERQPHQGWQWCGWKLSRNYSPNWEGIRIPRNAASVRILFSHTWKVAGLTFSELPSNG